MPHTSHLTQSVSRRPPTEHYQGERRRRARESVSESPREKEKERREERKASACAVDTM